MSASCTSIADMCARCAPERRHDRLWCSALAHVSLNRGAIATSEPSLETPFEDPTTASGHEASRAAHDGAAATADGGGPVGVARARSGRRHARLCARASIEAPHRRGGGAARSFARTGRVERIAAQAPTSTARRRADAPADADRLDDAAATTTASRHAGGGDELARARGREDANDSQQRARVEERARREGERFERAPPKADPARRGLNPQHVEGGCRRGAAGRFTAAPPRGASQRRLASRRTRTSCRAARNRHV